MISVLFVCLGNICRSPTAEGVFRSMVEAEGLSKRISIDSAGTAAYHIGEPPDRRAMTEAKNRGIDISRLRGRQANAGDFKRFDYVLAMDSENYRNLVAICPSGYEARLSMFLDFAPGLGIQNVPDPYYEGGFGSVYEMIEKAASGLLDDIKSKHLS
ncbi:MAG: low molecular weight phosphotyrosine protein phosphatase [Rhodospirillaceae bacterium]|nr:low molecular weight phosphotyrosine protein phosphatase [Rhodospirillaceae bacterium]